MDRRVFLGALGGGLASTVATRAAARQPPRPALISTYVSNVADMAASDRLPSAGSSLGLKVDTDRVYDPRSVLVSTADGRPLGYLPSVHGRTIEPLLSAGFSMEARAVAIRTLPRPWIRVEISLRPHAPDKPPV